MKNIIGTATFSHESGFAGAIFEIDAPGLGHPLSFVVCRLPQES